MIEAGRRGLLSSEGQLGVVFSATLPSRSNDVRLCWRRRKPWEQDGGGVLRSSSGWAHQLGRAPRVLLGLLRVASREGKQSSILCSELIKGCDLLHHLGSMWGRSALTSLINRAY